MIKFTDYQLATIISVPIVTVLLVWTLTIFHKNRKKWRAFDIPIVAILVQSILRNIAIVTYVTIQKLEKPTLDVNYCSVFVWVFNSIHTFQASCLTTLAVVGLFSLKLYKKQQNLKQYLTTTHVIYHLFCLTTLCACVGVAAILAKQDAFAFESTENACKLMPYELDVKFNVFIIVLHVFLTIISIGTFFYITCIYCKLKRDGFNHLTKSKNHLSQLSLAVVNPSDQKNYYDTYTIQRNGSYGRYDSQLDAPGIPYTNGYTTIWKSDISNVSTTVSSTNSRKPLNKAEDEEHPGTGLETIHPVLIVCYLFYHAPIIVLSIFPHLILPWTVPTIALWLGLLQDLLIPISLGLVDTRFCQWVSEVYKCSEKKVIEGKLPHVGLDGKFRHFGSQPQSLESNQMLPSHLPNGRSYQTEHKFPITNGSLYTSIDGRLPVIHNYRRHNDNRIKMPETNLINLGMHSSNLQRQDLREFHQKQLNFRCTNCEKSQCANNSDFIRNSVYNLNLNQQNQVLLKPYLRHISLSQSSLRQIPLGPPIGEAKPEKLISRNNLRLSKSYDSLNDLQSDLTKFKQTQREKQVIANLADSDEEYFSDSVNNANYTNYTNYDQNFDTLSTESSYSITTEANCDFEFYQNDAPASVAQFQPINFKIGARVNQPASQPDATPNDSIVCQGDSHLSQLDSELSRSQIKLGTRVQPKLSRNSSKTSSFNDLCKNYRIKRSNSKRSLENLQAYVDSDDFFSSNNNSLQRANSFMVLDDRKHVRYVNVGLDYPQINERNFPNSRYENLNHKGHFYAGSVPDFKKVFISDYI